ncbi:hypothetical protein XINFAN_04121 [Pseudogemmobacter humi]|uniref:Uncharacterized protein n=1 Tax=Pseudogemmobacter humi TaxID=2483812 RepID=A0A3P5XGJ8_9RHOB|nr:hypothetical protein XINFAN_04121 [Pseudogemmobacter humi]
MGKGIKSDAVCSTNCDTVYTNQRRKTSIHPAQNLARPRICSRRTISVRKSGNRQTAYPGQGALHRNRYGFISPSRRHGSGLTVEDSRHSPLPEPVGSRSRADRFAARNQPPAGSAGTEATPGRHVVTGGGKGRKGALVICRATPMPSPALRPSMERAAGGWLPHGDQPGRMAGRMGAHGWNGGLWHRFITPRRGRRGRRSLLCRYYPVRPGGIPCLMRNPRGRSMFIAAPFPRRSRGWCSPESPHDHRSDFGNIAKTSRPGLLTAGVLAK